MALLLAHDGRYLVTQAFAAACWHQHQGIASRRHMLHDGLLRPAKGVIAKGIFQNGVNGGHRATQSNNKTNIKGSQPARRLLCAEVQFAEGKHRFMVFRPCFVEFGLQKIGFCMAKI